MVLPSLIGNYPIRDKKCWNIAGIVVLQELLAKLTFGLPVHSRQVRCSFNLENTRAPDIPLSPATAPAWSPLDSYLPVI